MKAATLACLILEARLVLSSYLTQVQMFGQTPSYAAEVNRAVRQKLKAIASVQEAHHQSHVLSSFPRMDGYLMLHVIITGLSFLSWLVPLPGPESNLSESPFSRSCSGRGWIFR